jgi:hypothetical protein
MAEILPADVHSASDNPDKVNIPEYLHGVDNSTFLLKSFTLQLCDLILWYRNYLREHPDEELNALEWDVINKNAIQ